MVSFTDHYNAISIDRLPSKTKIGNNSCKRLRKINIFYVSPSPPQLQRLCFFKKFFLLKHKKQPLQQVAGGKEPSLVLKRMPEAFLKVPRLKKILENFEKKKFEPKTKAMIQNLQNKLYQLENKQTKDA